ncbi:DUF418 domain-containing protein [Pendulispora rubella]|uniref:DUF418 domain-containing protein n=1 Tax=Pendulispora rubella TaxID=2741070 RepID=A0ABZ2KZF9_9BACT
MLEVALPEARDGGVDASRATPVGTASRIQDLDVLRGAALLGVLMMNLVDGFRVPYPLRFPLTPDPSWVNRAAQNVLAVVLQGKAMTMFSLLFGVGMCIFYERAQARGASPIPLLARRLIVLLAFGLAHMLLLWNGDVLTSYAVSGLIALPLIRRRPATLLAVAVALLGGRAFILWLWPTLIPPSGGATAEHYRDALSIYGSGSYFDVVKFRASEVWYFMFRFSFLEVPTEVSNFLIGACIWHAGILRDVERYRHPLVWVARIGIAVGAGYAILRLTPAGEALNPHAKDEILRASSSAILRLFTLGYGALFLLLLQRPGARAALLRIAPLGQMAFTNYLSHSFFFTTLFYGYAFGLLTTVGVAWAMVLGVAVYIGQCILSTYWLRRFRFGPFEWAWRCLTYGKLQPMRR